MTDSENLARCLSEERYDARTPALLRAEVLLLRSLLSNAVDEMKKSQSESDGLKDTVDKLGKTMDQVRRGLRENKQILDHHF